MKQKGEKVEINVRIAVTLVKWAIEAIFFFFISLLHKLETRFTGVCKSEIHIHRCAHINSARNMRFQHYQCTDIKH